MATDRTPARGRRTGLAATSHPSSRSAPKATSGTAVRLRAEPGEIVIVLNPGDDLAVAQHLAVVHDLRARRLVVSPHRLTPGSSKASLSAARKRLGADLLAALGKDPDDIARHRGEALALAGDWIRGEGITDLVVDRAHDLHREVLRELATFAQDAPVRLWLIWAAAAPRQLDLGRAKLHTVNAEHFGDALPATRATAGAGAAARQAPPEWPALPSSDFPVFMEVCRTRMDPDAFQRVAEIFDLAREAATEWSAKNILVTGGSTYRQGTLHRVEAWLRDEVLTTSQHPAQLLVTLRAVQAALFEANHFLRWRRSLLPNPPQAHLATRLTNDVTERLRRLCSPEAAAAVVFQLHLASDPSYFQVRQLSSDGSWWTAQVPRDTFVAPVVHRFPRSAHGILAAHLAQRRAEGADGEDLLFDSAPRRTSPEQLRRWLGVPALAKPSSVPSDCSTPWLAERGLSLHHLQPYAIRDGRR